ncbi:MAG: cytochrome c biogenesis CcdA family protein [Candidatus Nezhaarchaeota archaeon]|nr:cytochrome c biogenesis CcdA family protein [Candidatus Nezhaarchaeota archaeon]MCX8142164.1 cytochrome c biogenesis CcdA family protein [Candidatus Nezhaarchaeota archaeon]MDW8050053.1 cytochrome c biogenesis CcdA family protein [Nitrososphaerota archaeon]
MPLDLLELVLVFTAGLLTLFSPCSFPLLPGYISYYLGSNAPLTRAYTVGLACALGIIAVFLAIGVAVSMLGDLASKHIPFLQAIAGVAIIIMGATMIAQIKLPTISVKSKAPRMRNLAGVFSYGVIYGLVASGCSAPIFLSIMLYAFASGGMLYGMIVFITYAMGVGLPIIAISILTAKAKEALLRRIVKRTLLLQLVGSLILITIGIYLISSYLYPFTL